jgi:hypothetical protein
MNKRDQLLINTLANLDFLWEAEAGDEFWFDTGYNLRDSIRELLTDEEKALVAKKIEEIERDSGWNDTEKTDE